MSKFFKTFQIVSAKNDGKGSILQFQITTSEDVNARYVFLTAAKQKPDTNSETAKFDYDNSEKMKLGFADIGSILAVLTNRESSINNEKGLYHEFKKGDELVRSSLKLKKNDPKYGGYFLNLQKGDIQIAAPITNANAVLLQTFLNLALTYMFGGEIK